MEVIQQYLPVVNSILQVLGGVCILATLVARLTPSPKDDEVMNSVTEYYYKVIHFLPTIGVNPQTKKLEEALVEAEAKAVLPKPHV